MKKIWTLVFIFSVGVSFSQTKVVHLVAEMNKVHILDDGSEVEMWGFGYVKASLPGPTLVFDLGDTVEIHLHNESAEDHTIHLHGLDVAQMEDGVPMTSYPVAPFDSTTYSFVATHAGSFLYHCHVMTPLHLMMGMYGVIVIRNKPDTTLIYQGGPSFTKEHIFLASDMDRSVNLQPTDPGLFHLFVSDYFMINGLAGIPLLTEPDFQVIAYPGDSVLLRLSSMAYSKVRFIFPEELNAIAYMSDGRPLPSPYACDTLTLFAGERYEVLLTPTSITTLDIQVEYYESRNDELQHINYISVNDDVGLENYQPTVFSIYPNPVTGILNFVTETPGSMLQVSNLSGQVIFEKLITSSQNEIDFSSLPKGVYIVAYRGSVQKVVRV